MIRYALKRLWLGAIIISVAMMMMFAMVYLIPGDPASVALGPRATPEMKEALRERMGLDQPVWRQFVNFYGSALHGDLGTEVLSNRPVLDVVMEQLPFTLALVVGGITWSVALGIPLGCIAAVRRGGFVDQVIGVLSVAMIAVPSFVVAIYSLLVFAVALQWLPAIGAGEPGDLASRLQHLILPSLAVGLGWIGYISRMVRASMLETLEASHIRTARAFGLTEHRIVYTYALRIACRRSPCSASASATCCRLPFSPKSSSPAPASASWSMRRSRCATTPSSPEPCWSPRSSSSSST